MNYHSPNWILLSMSIAFAAGANAQTIILSDDMNYASSALMQAAWAQGTSTAGSLPAVATTTNFGPAPLASFNVSPGTFMSLNNGVVFRDLGTTLTSDFTLDLKMLGTTYARSWSVWMLDSTGTQGYGVHWNTSLVNNNSGNGVMSIARFNNSTYTNHGTFGTGTSIATTNSHLHAPTGYAVLSASSSDASAASYNTSLWQGFANVQLTWSNTTDTLTLFVDGVQRAQVVDTNFSSFSRVYLRGNSNGYFDDLTVSTVPEPSVGMLIAVGCASFLGVRRFSGRDRRRCSLAK